MNQHTPRRCHYCKCRVRALRHKSGIYRRLGCKCRKEASAKEPTNGQ